MNTRLVGAEYEARADEYLESRGYRIISRNYRCKAGEIDRIARVDGYLVFIEAKYRESGRNGSASEAVDLKKQKRIVRVARWYLMEHHIPEEQPVRFDVVAFDGRDVRLICDAFWT